MSELAATHRNLEEAVSKALFVKTYIRLNVLRIILPPLRERKDDIPLLIDYLIEKICGRTNRLQPKISDKY